MTLDQLRYAVEVLRSKQFSKAASNCHISQPSLSVQIANLEEEIGEKIFIRSHHGVEVTKFGAEFLKEAQAILNQADRLQHLSKEKKGELNGKIRLGIIPSVSSSLLPVFLEPFLSKFNEADITVVEETTSQLVSDLERGTLDCAILSPPEKCPSNLVEIALFYEPFFIFASNNHPILKQKNILANKLYPNNILLLNEAHCLRDQVLQICSPAFEKKVDSKDSLQEKKISLSDRLNIESSGLLTLIEVVRSTEGYTLLPAMAVSLLTEVEREQNLRKFSRPYPSRKISLLYHQDRNKKLLAKALAQEIQLHVPDSVYSNKKSDLKVLFPSPDYFEI